MVSKSQLDGVKESTLLNDLAISGSTPNLPVQQVSFIPDMDDSQLRKLAREKLSMALQAISPSDQPEMTRKLCAELMDRLDGKPVQSVKADVDNKQKLVVQIVQFNNVELPNGIDRARVIDGKAE